MLQKLAKVCKAFSISILLPPITLSRCMELHIHNVHRTVIRDVTNVIAAPPAMTHLAYWLLSIQCPAQCFNILF